MEIIIRKIEEKDYLEVLSLWNNELGNLRVTAENIATHYDRVKDDERYKTFVALFENEVGLEVGFIHIVGLAVKNEKQGKGIGTKLLQYIEDYAREKGVYRIILNSGIKRTEAHLFYEHNNYDKGSWCFGKTL